MASSRGVTTPTYPRTDGEKLRTLAVWLDRINTILETTGVILIMPDDEIQQDLRRIADRLDEIDCFQDCPCMCHDSDAHNPVAGAGNCYCQC